MKNWLIAFAVALWLAPAGAAYAQDNWAELNKKSMAAYTAKDYQTAFTYTQQALAQAQKEFGAEGSNYAMSAHNLGYLYSQRKEYTEAAKYYLQSIGIRTKLNLEADLAMSASQYGSMLYRNVKDLVNAEKYLLIARDLNKKLYTEKSQQYYSVASELVLMYVSAGKYQQAEPYYLYMKEATKEQKGVNSEEYAYVIRDIMIMYRELGNNEKYFAAMEEMLDIQAHFGLNNTQGYFGGLLITAQYYEKQENFAKAVRLYQKMVNETKKAYSDTSGVYLSSLVGLIGVYGKQADYRGMSAGTIELVDILKRMPQEKGAYIDALGGAGSVFEMTGDYTRAEEVLGTLTAALKKNKGAQSTEYQLAMRKLGDVQLSLGKHGEAEKTYREILATRKQKDTDYATDLIKIGRVIAIVGRLNEAEKNYLEARQIFISYKKEKTNEYAVLLNYLGGLYGGTGRMEEGEAMLNQARTISLATVGDKHQNYGTILSSLADIYMQKGNYSGTEQLLLQYLDIKGSVYGKEHPEYAYALVHLAMFYKNMGNTSKWERSLLDALDIQNKVLPAEHPSLMTTLNNLAVFYNNSRQYDKAEPLYVRSMEISRKTLGERQDYLNTQTNLAGLYVNLKQFDKALELYGKSAELARKLYGEALQYSNVIQGIGALYDYKGEYAKAEPYFLQSLDIRKKLLPETNPAYIQMYINMGRLYQAMHNYAKAEPYYAKAREQMLSSIDKNFAFLSEGEKQDFLNTLNYRFELLQNFYLNYQGQNPEAAGMAFSSELATKGLTLNSSIEMRKAIAQSNNAEALKLYDEWMGIRAEIAKRNTSVAENTEVEVLESKAAELEKQLTRLSAQYNEGRVLARAGLEDVKQKLGDNDVAVEFASFYKFDDINWQDSVIYAAIVLRKGDPYPKMIRLAEARQFEEIMQKKGQDDDGFVSSLYRGTAGANVRSNHSLSNGKRLYELVWKPIDHLLKEGDRIYFAPAGILHQVAFAAIPYGDDKLISDRYKLSQLSSTAMLLKPTAQNKVSQSIALFGGIKYDLTAAEKAAAAKATGGTGTVTALAVETGRGNAWSYLPGTLSEAEAIGKLAVAAGYGTKTYFGANGMEENLKKQSGKDAPGIIHIASHGFFFPDPEQNYAKQENAAGNVFAGSGNVMNRSGMLFAGANDAWLGRTSATTEDGILTAYEASNLSLANTSLVVLSACETGLGDIKGNEGVYGLQRSFKMAGAGYLMMSLWKVPDAETAEFMQQFYSGLFSGKGIEASFATAQDTMKAKYPKEPYKWAAFVLVK